MHLYESKYRSHPVFHQLNGMGICNNKISLSSTYLIVIDCNPWEQTLEVVMIRILTLWSTNKAQVETIKSMPLITSINL